MTDLQKIQSLAVKIEALTATIGSDWGIPLAAEHARQIFVITTRLAILAEAKNTGTACKSDDKRMI